MNKAWIYVFLTSLFELFWIFGFNVSTVWWHWLIVAICLTFDLHFLAKACASLPTGTVYAIFAGAGTIGTALMDVYIFGDILNLTRIFFMAMIIAGVIGLKLTDNEQENIEKGVAQ